MNNMDHLFRIIPESARWLVSQKRYEEANAVLQRAAKINKTQIPDQWWEEVDVGNSGASPEKTPALNRKHNMLDLLKTPRLRLISLVAFFCW